MARPIMVDRTKVKEVRITVKMSQLQAGRLRAIAARLYDGNSSALARVALDEFLKKFEEQELSK